MSKEQEEEVVEEEELIDIWGDDEEEKEEEVVEEEKEEVVEEEKEEVVEEEKPDNIEVKARVRKRQEENEEIEQRKKQTEKMEYADEDFKTAMDFQFSDNDFMSEGEAKKLNDIASEYPDVTALIKDAVGQVKKELSARLDTAQGFIDNETFWSKVESHYPNARKMSDDKEFMEWTEADSDIQTLVSTGDPDDIIFVLDAWEKQKKPKVDVKKEAKKNILKKSQGSTVKNKPVEETEEVTPELRKSIWG